MVRPQYQTMTADEILQRLRNGSATQREIAEAIGIPRTGVSNLLNGKRQLKAIEAEKLAAWLDVTAAPSLPHERILPSIDLIKEAVRVIMLSAPANAAAEEDWLLAIAAAFREWLQSPHSASGTSAADVARLAVKLARAGEGK